MTKSIKVSLSDVDFRKMEQLIKEGNGFCWADFMRRATTRYIEELLKKDVIE